MSVPVAVVAVVLLLSAVVFTLRERYRGGSGPGHRAVCACLAALGAGTAAQAFAGAIDTGTGIVHLAEAIADAGAMVAAHTGRVFFATVNFPAETALPRVRRYRIVLAAALSVFFALFFAFPPSPRPHAEGAFFLVYIGYAGLTLASVGRLSARYARLVDRRPLRAGLRLIAAGAGCGLAFLGFKALLLAGDALGARLDRQVGGLALPLELMTELLLAVGIILPAVGGWLGQAVQWVRDHRSYRLLHPLWLALHYASPELTLLPPRDSRGWHRDVGFLLYRQVIEIRDGQLALRPYADGRAAKAARVLARRAGLAAEDVNAAGEAAAIAAGIAAKSSGRPPDPAAPAPAPAPGGADLAAEVAFLTRVALAFTTSPIVTQVLAAHPGMAEDR